MNLKESLAVSRSFAGMKDEKSPFAMRKNGLLPVFGSAPRFARTHAEAAPAPALKQADWIEAEREPDSAAQSEPRAEAPLTAAIPAAGASAELRSTPQPEAARKPRRKWLAFFTGGIFGSRTAPQEMVQSELSLDKVRVLRNDLADSDLELVLRKKKKMATNPPAETAPQPARAAKPWNRLASRLFEIGQH